MTETRGKDFNFYEEIAVTAGAFATDPDAISLFRGPRSMMLVCTAGDVEYSFNGTTVHGKISADQIFNFGLRNEDKVFLQGSGTIQIHMWRV